MDNLSIKTVNDFLNCGLNVDKEFMLLIQLDGFESSVKEQAQIVNNLLIKTGATDIKIANDENEAEKVWSARNSSFSAATRLAPDVLSDDIIVPRDRLAEMITACREISEKYNEISNQISKQVLRGATGIYSKGMYTNEKKMMLMCIASRREIIEIRQIANKIDPKSFTIIFTACNNISSLIALIFIIQLILTTKTLFLKHFYAPFK